MVAFKNRYLVMEVFLNPNRDHTGDNPVILTQFNILKAINESILVNFGECGFASITGSLQVKIVNPITNVCIIRTARENYQKVWCAITLIRDIANCPVVFNLLDISGSKEACKTAALKCEESKFEQCKLTLGDRLSTNDTNRMQTILDKIKVLER